MLKNIPAPMQCGVAVLEYGDKSCSTSINHASDPPDAGSDRFFFRNFEMPDRSGVRHVWSAAEFD
jgi:hypothetical protein